jgi:hypothetical protein
MGLGKKYTIGKQDGARWGDPGDAEGKKLELRAGKEGVYIEPSR